MAPRWWDLCIITDRASSGLSHTEVVSRALAGGATMIQLREKSPNLRVLWEEGKMIRAACRAHSACFIVNDRVDLALALEADGVHLGQEDLPATEARHLLPAGMLLGVSTHSMAQARQAVMDGADYIGVGPIFATRTKIRPDPPLGLAGLASIRQAIKLPILAIGGIGLHEVEEIIRAGADGVAVISAITGAPDITTAVRQFRQAIDRVRREGPGRKAVRGQS